jgi:hypothetical protein
LRGALARQDRGEPLEDPDITFETLFNEWFDGEKKKRKARTLEIYRDNYKYYIEPAFGAARISSITSRDVQKWVNKLLLWLGSKNTGRGSLNSACVWGATGTITTWYSRTKLASR